jgi:hypothetical protein
MEVSGQLQASAALPSSASPRYPVDKSWVGTRTGLDAVGKEIDTAPPRNRNRVVQPLD